MKFFAIVAVFVCLAVAVHSDDMKVGSSYGGGAAAPSYGGSAAAPSYGGSSGGYGASIPAPPCPKNYLFSCQPSLQPAPCAQPAAGYGGYGSVGAYSENYPVYGVPQYAIKH